MNTPTPDPTMQPASQARNTLLAKLWCSLSHPLPRRLLLGIAALALGLHLWLPQLPTALAARPEAANLWLDKTAAAYPAGHLLRTLGAFDLAHHLGLRILLALLGALLLINLFNKIWRIRATQKLNPPLHSLPGLSSWDADLPRPPSAETLTRACATLCQRLRQTASEPEPETQQRVCDCNARQQILTLLTDLGLLLAWTALLLNLITGWQTDTLNLDWGETISLAPYAPLQVGLSADGSQLSLCCPQQQAPVARGRIMRGDTSLHILRQNSALKLSLKQGQKPLKLQAIEQRAPAATELMVHFPQARSERAIAAPQIQRFFRLTALDDGSFRVQELDGNNQVLLTQTIDHDTTLPLDENLTLTLQPRTTLILNAQGRPGTRLLWPALALLLIGLVAQWRWPYWRLGIRSNKAGAALRWQGARRTRIQFDTLLHQLASPNEPDETP